MFEAQLFFAYRKISQNFERFVEVPNYLNFFLRRISHFPYYYVFVLEVIELSVMFHVVSREISLKLRSAKVFK
jgi:hypothetical protein